MSDAIPLPARPNLEQYKKLAREFQSACKTGSPGAIAHSAERWLDGTAARKLERRWRALQKANEGAAA